MSPAVKYTLGRIGLFMAAFLALWPVELNIFVKLMLALAFSAALSFFLLRGWRAEMAQQMADAAQRRRDEKERLWAALAGDDTGTEHRDTAGTRPDTDRSDSPRPDTDRPDPKSRS